MKILLTGATGLVGRRLGQQLVRQGHQLVVLTRSAAEARLHLPYPAQILEWTGETLPAQATEQIEAVIHLAGESVAKARWSEAQKQRIFKSRVDSTQALHQAFQKQKSKLKVWINASAVGIYGDGGERLCTETDLAMTPDFLSQVCTEWEKALWATSDVSERQVAVRTGLVLSLQGGALPPLLRVVRSGFAGPLGSGAQWVSWIHLEDLVRIYLWALETASVSGPINAVAPYPLTNREMTQTLARLFAKPSLVRTPKMALQVALGEMGQLLLSSQKVSAQRLEQAGFRFAFDQFENAARDLCQAQLEGDEEWVTEQWIPRPIEKVFDFFSQEVNLEALTPHFLHFKVLGKSTPRIEEGTLIDYSLKVHGIPIRWQSRIEEWKPVTRFVDTQTRGPYRKWHHTHTFEPLGSGTLICDRVRFRLPWGLLGRVFGGAKVKNDVKTIFDYRRTKIGEIFS